jgi:uncharacterized protein (DUF433 family)
MNSTKRKPVNELAKIVYRDEEILGGTPCFQGTRVPVSLIVEYLVLGWTLADLKEFYPTVKPEHITRLMQVLAEEFAGDVKTA